MEFGILNIILFTSIEISAKQPIKVGIYMPHHCLLLYFVYGKIYRSFPFNIDFQLTFNATTKT